MTIKVEETPTDGKLAWGIIGTGNIASAFARGLAGSHSGKLVGVGSRTMAGAETFGKKFDVPHRHGSYEALLADPQVTAVYISTPHPQHMEWAIKAAQAGKHILCEKPLAMNYAQAAQIVEAARQNNVFLMEAFMYRCHPQTARLVELIRQGTIGEVRLIQASFSFNGGFNLESRLLNKKLGGGGILDVGCYPVSLARLVAGAATGQAFAEPLNWQGAGHIGNRSGVDEYATALLTFPGDILAQLNCGVLLNTENVVRIFGTEGHLVVPNPWTPNVRGAGSSRIIVYRQGNRNRFRWQRWLWRQSWWQSTLGHRTVKVETEEGLYALEADRVAAHLADKQAPSPAMSWEDSLGNMRTLDKWREAIGLTYEADTSK